MNAVKPRPGPVSKVARRRAERMVADSLPDLVRRALELAALGDSAALVALLDRAWPVAPKDSAPPPAARP